MFGDPGKRAVLPRATERRRDRPNQQIRDKRRARKGHLRQEGHPPRARATQRNPRHPQQLSRNRRLERQQFHRTDRRNLQAKQRKCTQKPFELIRTCYCTLQMTISSNGKSDRDSNTECSSVENERRTPLTSDSSPSPSSTCAEEAERSSVSTSQQYLKTDVTNDTACQAKAKDPKCMAPCIAPLPFALGRSASSTSGPSVQSISTQSSTLSGKVGELRCIFYQMSLRSRFRA